jgi:predicted RNA-binding Zn ribbon-like protein
MKDSGKSGKFLWLGNDPAIDFANTEIVQDGQTVDLLEKPDDLLDWMAAAEMLSSRALKDVKRALSQPQLQKALTRACEYRRVLKAALENLHQHKHMYTDRAAIAETNRLLVCPRTTFTLSAVEKSLQLRHNWAVTEPDDLSRPIALAFALLFTTQDAGRIRKCQNPDCVLFFLDTSKSGTRAWCSMEICGNKLRVAAFRKRHENGNDVTK